jgi:hypothetical protein
MSGSVVMFSMLCALAQINQPKTHPCPPQDSCLSEFLHVGMELLLCRPASPLMTG